MKLRLEPLLSSLEVASRKLKFPFPQIVPVKSVNVWTITIELLFIGKTDLKNKNYQEKEGQVSAHEEHLIPLGSAAPSGESDPIPLMSFCYEGRLTHFPLENELGLSDHLPNSAF